MRSLESHLPYRGEIDGIRALAVLPVLLFHAELGCPGGYVGVDVFFVISGYLIGSLILRENENGGFHFGRFWARRIRRLFPALAATLTVTVLVGSAVLIPKHVKEMGTALAAQPLLSANVLFWSRSGYFETASEYQPLLHTWSLAVEEQFYLLFPLVFVPLLKRGRQAAVAFTWIFIAASLAWSVHAVAHYPSAAFFLLPSRIWELGLGLALALLPRLEFRNAAFREIASFAGLAAILLPVFLYDATTPFPGIAALPPCLGTALVILSNSGPLTSSGRLLASPLPVWIGKISYPLYLWHWPALVFSRYHWIGASPLPLATGALAISFLLAWATWRWVERPVRERRILSDNRALLIASTAGSLAFVSTGALLDVKNGFPAATLTSDIASDPQEAPVEGFYAMRAWQRKGAPFIAGSRDAEAGNLLVWGDSHAMATLPVLDDLGLDHGVAVYAACEAGNVPLFGTRSTRTVLDGRDFEPELRKLLENEIFSGALLIGRWPVYLVRQPAARNFLLTDDTGSPVAESEAGEILRARLAETLRILSEKGIRVWVMRSVAHQPMSVPETIAQARSRGLDDNLFSLTLAEHDKADAHVNRLLDGALQGSEAVILDPRPLLTDSEGRYSMARNGRALYTDRSHLSPYGARQLRELFEPIFLEIGSSKADP